MAIDFSVKDVMHRITVKFVHAFLPEAKKPYNLRAVHQPVLGIHEVASKADVYNIQVSPKVIEEGAAAYMKLARYLAADGFRITNPIFNLGISVQGEYNGSETHLPDGVYPKAKLQTSVEFRKYLQENCKVTIDGVAGSEGLIAQATDEATELVDESATVGNLLTIRGYGLKIDGDAEHKGETGLYFESLCGGESVKAEIIAVNEPRTLKVIVPDGLKSGSCYSLKVVTQTPVKYGGALLKNTREIRSEFVLTA